MNKCATSIYATIYFFQHFQGFKTKFTNQVLCYGKYSCTLLSTVWPNLFWVYEKNYTQEKLHKHRLENLSHGHTSRLFGTYNTVSYNKISYKYCLGLRSTVIILVSPPPPPQTDEIFPDAIQYTIQHNAKRIISRYSIVSYCIMSHYCD